MKKFLRTTGLVSLVLGAVCWVSERIFFNGVDANGVLNESLFLPFTFGFVSLGIVFLVASVLFKFGR